MNSIPMPPARWLVVDDEPCLSDIIADTLAGLGLACVDRFTSPDAALGTLAAGLAGYDLIFTDRDMPGLNGLEFSRRLRAHAPGARVILVSAHVDDLPADELRRAGIDGVVPKPVRLAQLLDAARDHLPVFMPA